MTTRDDEKMRTSIGETPNLNNERGRPSLAQTVLPEDTAIKAAEVARTVTSAVEATERLVVRLPTIRFAKKDGTVVDLPLIDKILIGSDTHLDLTLPPNSDEATPRGSIDRFHAEIYFENGEIWVKKPEHGITMSISDGKNFAKARELNFKNPQKIYVGEFLHLSALQAESYTPIQMIEGVWEKPQVVQQMKEQLMNARKKLEEAIQEYIHYERRLKLYPKEQVLRRAYEALKGFKEKYESLQRCAEKNNIQMKDITEEVAKYLKIKSDQLVIAQQEPEKDGTKDQKEAVAESPTRIFPVLVLKRHTPNGLQTVTSFPLLLTGYPYFIGTSIRAFNQFALTGPQLELEAPEQEEQKNRSLWQKLNIKTVEESASKVSAKHSPQKLQSNLIRRSGK